MRYATIMDRVDAMKPQEAIDYLLAVVGDIMPVMTGKEHPVDGWGIRFTPCERIILCALVDASPRVLSDDQIRQVALQVGTQDRIIPSDAAKIFIHKIRRKIGKNHGIIENMWGRGYRYIRPIDGAMLS